MENFEDENPNDTFKILLATDCHLGCSEKEPERRDDALVTFEEILSLAHQHDVDFILLGGDLFHVNKPSRYVLHRCAELLRKYTLGDKPVEFEVLNAGDSALNCTVNYEDPNLNISYPVFSIHGNHDDPAGIQSLCALDLFSATGLINHFGKSASLERIEIKPVLLRKGCTKLALYGLGAIRDERLHRIFRERKVTMIRPEEDTDDWFNVFVIHQNRTKHSLTSYIPDSFLDDFLDLVIWGHEHECLITPEESTTKGFFVTQPGSSVATSLCVGESKKKHVGILLVYEQSFKITELPLKTVRPFVYEEIDLHNCDLKLIGQNITKKCMDYCESVVNQLIERSKDQLTGNSRQPSLPLIRLKVRYEDDEEAFSIYRFGQKFLGKVANPKDIIVFNRKKSKADDDRNGTDVAVDSLKLNEQDMIKFSAIDMVNDYFKNIDEGARLKLLTETGLGRAVREFVDKEEKDAISVLVSHQEKKTEEYLCNRETDLDGIDDEIRYFREDRQKRVTEEEEKEVNEVMLIARQRRVRNTADPDVEVASEEDENSEDGRIKSAVTARQPVSSGRGRRGRGQKSNASSANSNPGTSRSLRRAKPMQVSRKYEDDDDEVSIIDDDEPETRPRSTRTKMSLGRNASRPGIVFFEDSD